MFFATVHMKHHNYKVNKETRDKRHVTIINNNKINNYIYKWNEEGEWKSLGSNEIVVGK